MKNLFLAVAFLLSPTFLYAAEAKVEASASVVVQDEKYVVPVQKIEGAEAPIDLGEVIFLNLSKLDKKTPDYFTSYSVEWKIFDKGVEKKFFKTTDGNGVFFGSGVIKRKITVFAAVSYLYVVKDAEGKFVEAAVRTAFLNATVDVGGVGPTPPDVDPTDPEPTFVDGTFKLASTSYKLGKNKVAAGATKAAAAAELSKSFSSQAAKIAAGQELNTAEDIKRVLQEATTANREALKKAGVSNDVWDAFFVDLQEEIYGLYSSGKLKTKNDFATAWREISEGLSKVK